MAWEQIKIKTPIKIHNEYINIPSTIAKKITSNTIQVLYNGKEIAIKECEANEESAIKIYKTKYQSTIKNKGLMKKIKEYGYTEGEYTIEEETHEEKTIYIIKKPLD